MQVEITKKDILWGYISQIFNYGTGFFTLPIILNRLSQAEVGMNYVMLSIGALAAIADFGFSGQVGRNLTYILCGARQIQRGELTEKVNSSEVSVDYHLVNLVIQTAKFIYRRLSVALLLLMLTFGTAYMYRLTEGFTNVEHSLLIWLLYCLGTYFNFYFLYYNSLLSGAGLIMEQKKALIYSRIVYLLLCIGMLMAGYGLLSVVTATLVSPFVARYYSYFKFYTKEMKERLRGMTATKAEILDSISRIWYTARRSGTNMIGHFVATQAGTFFSGLYLTLDDTAEWGIMLQLYGIVSGLAMNMGMSIMPQLTKYRLQGDHVRFVRELGVSYAILLSILISGGVVISGVGPYALDLIHSKSQLPSLELMAFYFFSLIILHTAQLFACVLGAKNVIPSPTAVMITSVATVVLMVALLKFTNLGIWALALSPFLTGIAYTYWRWPQLVLRDYHINIFQLIRIGFVSIKNYKFK